MIGLEYICKIKNIEMRKIAIHLGISQAAVCDWVKMRRKIPKDRINHIADYLNVPSEFLQKEIKNDDKIKLLKLEIESINRGVSYL